MSENGCQRNQSSEGMTYLVYFVPSVTAESRSSQGEFSLNSKRSLRLSGKSGNGTYSSFFSNSEGLFPNTSRKARENAETFP